MNFKVSDSLIGQECPRVEGAFACFQEDLEESLISGRWGTPHEFLFNHSLEFLSVMFDRKITAVQDPTFDYYQNLVTVPYGKH